MRNWDIFSLEKRIFELEKGGKSDKSTIFEVVHESDITLKDNTDHTITVTKKYNNPYVFATNALPKSQWGGVIALTNFVYSSENNTVTFHYNSNDNTLANGQKYDIDWFVIDLPVVDNSLNRTKSKRSSKK